MTREEQIKEAAVSFCRVEEAPDGFAFIPQSSFVTGALWADAHPNWEAIVKRLREEITNDLRQDRWISVKDETPPRDGVYLVCTTDGSMLLAYHYTGLEMSDAITHWMPLPPPPSASEKPTNCMIKKGGEK